MRIKGPSETESGAVVINLSGDDIATAIDAYLVAHGVRLSGPRTIMLNGSLCERGRVLIDPSGFVMWNGERFGKQG